MNLAAQDTAHHLKAHPLPAISLIYGSEALLNAEALDALRARATADGFSERQRLYGDTRIDTLIAELETPSLFAPRRLLELYLDQKKADKATADTLTRLADLPLDNTRLIIYAPNLEKPHTTAWYKALFSKGNLAIASQALYPEQFAKQIRARLNAAKLRLTEAAYELLLANCQGNLFAAKQAIERLTIHPQAHNIIDETLLTELLDDFSQFNTFALSDAILGADWLNAWRIAARLEAESQAAAQREAARLAAQRQAEQARAAAAQAKQRQPEKPIVPQKAVLRQGDVVFFTGDSLMQGVAPFVQQSLKQQYGIASINLSKQSTGLSYPNFFDWPLTIEQTFKENPNIRLMVMFLGANDPWDFPNPKGGAYLKFQTPEWEAEYLNRVNRILDAAKQHNAQVIWLGMPYMKKKKLDDQMRYLDKLFAAHLKDKVFWIPTAGLLSNGGAEYSDSVEVGGKIVRYRSKDGIHFSVEGQKLLAQAIMQKIEFAQP